MYWRSKAKAREVRALAKGMRAERVRSEGLRDEPAEGVWGEVARDEPTEGVWAEVARDEPAEVPEAEVSPR